MGRNPLIAALAVAASAVAAAPAQASDHPLSFPTGVAPAQYAPSPDVAAAVHDTVTFSGGFANHPLVWDHGEFATQGTGTSHQYTFDQPGTYQFHCMIHPGIMHGTVTVAAAGQIGQPDFGVSPDAPQPGQPVTFTATAVSDPGATIARYEWDLDGDGTFETTTTAAQATTTYFVEQAVDVSLRVVDDANRTSPVATHLVTVAAAAPGSGPAAGSGTPGYDPSAGGPATGPAVTGTGTAPGSAVGVRSRALTFRAGVATVALRLTAAAPVSVTLRAGSLTLARGHAGLRAGDGRVRLRLTHAGAVLLRHAHRLRATLTIRAGASARTVPVRISVAPSAAHRRAGSSRR